MLGAAQLAPTVRTLLGDHRRAASFEHAAAHGRGRWLDFHRFVSMLDLDAPGRAMAVAEARATFSSLVARHVARTDHAGFPDDVC